MQPFSLQVIDVSFDDPKTRKELEEEYLWSVGEMPSRPRRGPEHRCACWHHCCLTLAIWRPSVKALLRTSFSQGFSDLLIVVKVIVLIIG